MFTRTVILLISLFLCSHVVHKDEVEITIEGIGTIRNVVTKK